MRGVKICLLFFFLQVEGSNAADFRAMSTQDSNVGAVPFVSIDVAEALPEDSGEDSSASPRKLARMLLAMGFFTLLMAVATLLYKPPRGVIVERYKQAYYLTLAAVSAAGMAEVSIAFCLSSCRLGRVILCASVAPFALIVALGGFSVLMRA